jgi:hypothetical protein
MEIFENYSGNTADVDQDDSNDLSNFDTRKMHHRRDAYIHRAVTLGMASSTTRPTGESAAVFPLQGSENFGLSMQWLRWCFTAW